MASSHLLLAVLKLFIGTVFVGWLMMWVVMPTNTYRNLWQPELQARLGNTTYFGSQGTSILILTFPIMFIAVLGSWYMHLSMRKDGNQSSSLSSRLDILRKPMIVRGPLGVLSRIELAFSFMFVALLIWFFWAYMANSFARITAKTAEEDGDKVWQYKLAIAALWLGLVGHLCCAFLFFPVTRGSSLLPLIDLTSESSIKYHVWIGHIVMTLFTAHGLCYITFWGVTGKISEMLKWDTIGISNVAGELALLSGLIMWVTTFPQIRCKFFELFFYSHHLYIFFLFFYVMHVGISCFCYILSGVYLFLVDRFLRFLQSRTRVRLLSVRLLPSETIELNFAKSPGFSYTPMSTIFINVPSISSLQWHPYTVNSSSSLEPEELTIIIKKEGSWTQKLYQKLSSTSLGHLDVSVEGPYSLASVDFLRYDSLVMVSGGSGITPFISIIRDLIHKSTILGTKTPTIHLICAFKTSADLTMLDLLLPLSTNVSDLSRLNITIDAFVTREINPSAHQKLIQTIWLKPNPSDVPVAPVLGQNGYLWLGAIISASFIGYLIVLALASSYYIYPIDKNTNEVYSNTLKSLLSLLFMCVCIVVTASVAVLWNKRRGTLEGKQVQNKDATTPQASSSSWASNADRELESVPSESLVQATKVNYGGRPDLKKMLLNSAGSSTGVMVSGPREMRHEVATICSSSSANNLHFESISFNW